MKAIGTKFGVHFKSAKIRGGVAENIAIHDVTMENVERPIAFELNWYFALTTTNLSLPVSQWTPFYTNTFDAFGNFACTNIVLSSAPQKYFTVQVS